MLRVAEKKQKSYSPGKTKKRKWNIFKFSYFKYIQKQRFIPFLLKINFYNLNSKIKYTPI